MDSTMRSNLGVGLPIDLAVIRRDSIDTEVVHRIHAGEPYFHDLRERWSAALRAAHIAIPRPPYGSKASEGGDATGPGRDAEEPATSISGPGAPRS
jgi:putative proteasome-type protease